MSVDTRSETVLTAAHNLRNQVMPSEAHRTFAADLLRALLTERDEAIRQREAAEQRASTLEDAAFHFQTCATCKLGGADSCESGRQFAAFLRGEETCDAR